MHKYSICHIVPLDERWAVEKEFGERPISLHATRSEAVFMGRATVGQEGGGELQVHGRDGRLHDRIEVPPS